MSIISAVRTYIKQYAGIDSKGKLLWVDYLSERAPGYTINPVDGERITSIDILGNTVREFPFAFQMMKRTVDDVQRTENIEFFEDLTAWMESQTELGELPILEEGKHALSIDTLGWGYLYETGPSDTGIYQILCRLEYEQNS